MTLEIGKRRQHQQHASSWRVWLLIPALLAIGSAGWLIYDSLHTQETTTKPSYSYTVDQSLTYGVSYLDNNYFEEKSPQRSVAFVRDITDTIEAAFSYTYQSSKPTTISYTYATTAHVVTSYTAKGVDTKPQTVWDATYPLTRAISRQDSNGTVSVKDVVSIPFREYSDRIARINSGLALSLNAEVIVTFSITVSGTDNGLPINEQRTMQLTIPLDQPIYSPVAKYDQRDAKTITDGHSEQPIPWWQANRTVLLTTSIIVLVLCAILYLRPWGRRYSERSPYQRELNKIYRYHDGLIIQTQKPLNLHGREVLEVNSFDDLLNLSEELRVPIIANKLSSEATRFLIVQDTTFYSYLVGRLVVDDDALPLPTTPRHKQVTTGKRAKH